MICMACAHPSPTRGLFDQPKSSTSLRPSWKIDGFRSRVGGSMSLTPISLNLAKGRNGSYAKLRHALWRQKPASFRGHIWQDAPIPPPSCTCRSSYSRDWKWRTEATTSWNCFSFLARVRVWVGVKIRGEKCFWGARNVPSERTQPQQKGDQLKSPSFSWPSWKFNDFRRRVGGSNLGHADLFTSTLGFFFCSKWRLWKISKSERQKRASRGMCEHTFMAFWLQFAIFSPVSNLSGTHAG